MKLCQTKLKIAILISAALLLLGVQVWAGTYIYTDKDGKSVTSVSIQPETSITKKTAESDKKSVQPPAGTPYQHNKKEKNKKKPEKFK